MIYDTVAFCRDQLFTHESSAYVIIDSSYLIFPFFFFLKLLCEFGSDPTSYLSGHSPVELAARHGQNKVIQVLLSYGAKYDDKGI